MDINMPDMDGITATELIRQHSPATQIVILSVQGDPNYMRRAMLAGISHWPPLWIGHRSDRRSQEDGARHQGAYQATGGGSSACDQLFWISL
jgi:CheY-like chemotaxis protein